MDQSLVYGSQNRMKLEWKTPLFQTTTKGLQRFQIRSHFHRSVVRNPIRNRIV